MVIQNINLEKIHVNEIHDAAVQERRRAVEYAVKRAVNKIADCSGKYHRQSDARNARGVAHGIEIRENPDAGKQREHAEENFRRCAEIYAERHAGVLHVCYAEELTDDVYRLRHWQPADMMPEQGNAFHP